MIAEIIPIKTHYGNILNKEHNLHAAQVVTPITSGEGEESGSGEAKETRAYSSRNPLPLGETSVSRSRRSVHKQKRRNAALMRGSSAPVDGDVLCNQSRAERSRSRSTRFLTYEITWFGQMLQRALVGRALVCIVPQRRIVTQVRGAKFNDESSRGAYRRVKYRNFCDEELWASFRRKCRAT